MLTSPRREVIGANWKFATFKWKFPIDGNDFQVRHPSLKLKTELVAFKVPKDNYITYEDSLNNIFRSPHLMLMVIAQNVDSLRMPKLVYPWPRYDMLILCNSITFHKYGSNGKQDSECGKGLKMSIEYQKGNQFPPLPKKTIARQCSS